MDLLMNARTNADQIGSWYRTLRNYDRGTETVESNTRP